MPDKDHADASKLDALRRQGTLNPSPRGVKHPLFQGSEFFDPRDLVQVKYEMLREVAVEDRSVSQSATAFGFSRPSFYQAQAAFGREGLSGLIPRKRGPHGAHKLTPEVMAFVDATLETNPSSGIEELAQRIEEQFGLRVHPRTIERRLSKKTAVMQSVLSSRPVANANLVTRYEELRRQALTPKSWGGGTQGLALLKGWMDAWSRCHIVEPAKALIDSRSVEEVVPRNLHAEVVTILAAMAFSIGTETRV